MAFLPWTLLAVAICAQRAGTPSSLTDLVRDILPDSALRRWSLSFPILAFTSGLLLAFALVEPRVGERPAEPESRRGRAETIDDAEPAPPLGPSGRDVGRCLRVLRRALFGNGVHAPA